LLYSLKSIQCHLHAHDIKPSVRSSSSVLCLLSKHNADHCPICKKPVSSEIRGLIKGGPKHVVCFFKDCSNIRSNILMFTFTHSLWKRRRSTVLYKFLLICQIPDPLISRQVFLNDQIYINPRYKVLT